MRGQTNIVFLFIGGGALTAELKSEVERRGLAQAFRFMPYQDASLLPQSLALPDIHWISLRQEMEGLIVPSKFYGIAAAGRATIAVADPDGEIATLVTRYDCGETVAPGDSNRLAEIIRLHAEDPSRRLRMGHNARDMLDRAFSRDFCLKKWERLFADPAFTSICDMSFFAQQGSMALHTLKALRPLFFRSVHRRGAQRP